MGTKNNPGKFDCYAAADPDEPMFVLLGRDPVAGPLVALWVYLRQRLSKGEGAKYEEAAQCAGAMEKWARDLGKGEHVDAAAGMAAMMKEAELVLRKNAHGCNDARCAECDDEDAEAKAEENNDEWMLERAWDQGFDTSFPSDEGGVEIRCSECVAVVVNGIPCHEQGCPNINIARDEPRDG